MNESQKRFKLEIRWEKAGSIYPVDILDFPERSTWIIDSGGKEWTHRRYPGKLIWKEINEGRAVGEIILESLEDEDSDSQWQILKALVGYVDRYKSLISLEMNFSD